MALGLIERKSHLLLALGARPDMEEPLAAPGRIKGTILIVVVSRRLPRGARLDGLLHQRAAKVLVPAPLFMLSSGRGLASILFSLALLRDRYVSHA